MDFFAKGLDRLTTVLAVIAGIAVVVMMIHVDLDVIMRATLNQVPPGTIVFVSNWYMPFLVCLPLAFVERAGGHIAVDVFVVRTPVWFQRRLAGWIYLLSALVFALVAYASWIEAFAQFRRGSFMLEQDVRIPVWYGYFAIPIGYGLGAAYMLRRFLTFISGGGVSLSPADGFDESVLGEDQDGPRHD